MMISVKFNAVKTKIVNLRFVTPQAFVLPTNLAIKHEIAIELEQLLPRKENVLVGTIKKRLQHKKV